MISFCFWKNWNYIIYFTLLPGLSDCNTILTLLRLEVKGMVSAVPFASLICRSTIGSSLILHQTIYIVLNRFKCNFVRVIYSWGLDYSCNMIRILIIITFNLLYWLLNFWCFMKKVNIIFNIYRWSKSIKFWIFILRTRAEGNGTIKIWVLRL